MAVPVPVVAVSDHSLTAFLVDNWAINWWVVIKRPC